MCLILHQVFYFNVYIYTICEMLSKKCQPFNLTCLHKPRRYSQFSACCFRHPEEVEGFSANFNFAFLHPLVRTEQSTFLSFCKNNQNGKVFECISGNSFNLQMHALRKGCSAKKFKNLICSLLKVCVRQQQVCRRKDPIYKTG